MDEIAEGTIYELGKKIEQLEKNVTVLEDTLTRAVTLLCSVVETGDTASNMLVGLTAVVKEIQKRLDDAELGD